MKEKKTLYIFRTKYFLANQIKFGYYLLIEKPEFPLSLIAFLFYFFYTKYLNFQISITIAILTSFMNFLLFVWGRKKIQDRLRQKDIILFVELGISILLLLILFIVIELKQTLLIQIEFFILASLLISFSFKKVGFFYTFFTGILIFSLIFFSYQLIILQERMVIWALYRSQREALSHTGNWEKEKSLLSNKGENNYSLKLDKGKLVVTIPNGLWFHQGKSSGYDPGFPIIGEPLCYVSASKQDPYAPPVLGLYLKIFPAHKKKTPQEQESFFAEMKGLGKKVLGYRKNRGEIHRIRYEGRYKIAFGKKKQTKWNESKEVNRNQDILDTVSYSYQQRRSEVKLYLHLAISQAKLSFKTQAQAKTNSILVYVLSDKIPDKTILKQKPLSPELLELLSGIRFISNRK